MITVVGSINLDLIAAMDRLPLPGETVPGNSFRTAAGGKGANQALAAARAGAAVRMVGAVGRDSFAPEALAMLREAGVDLGLVAERDTATGIAVIFVMGLASAICWVVNQYILMKLGLGFMQTLTYILVIAVLVQFVEMFLKKSVPSLYSALGIYLPLITTNCAVLGVVLLNTQNNYNFLESTVYGITGGMGFMLAICLFASVREKLEFADYPKCFEGFPICLVSAGLLSLAFMGFSGMKIF